MSPTVDRKRAAAGDRDAYTDFLDERRLSTAAAAQRTEGNLPGPRHSGGERFRRGGLVAFFRGLSGEGRAA